MDHLFRLELIKILTLLSRESEHNLKDTGSEYQIKKALSFMPVLESNESHKDSLTALRQILEHYRAEAAISRVNKDDLLQS